MNKVFSPLNSSRVEVLEELPQAILRSHFCTPGCGDELMEVVLAVTNNFLIVSQVEASPIQDVGCSEHSIYCRMTFDLKFDVLRREWPDERTPGLPYGIRFQAGANNDAVEFYNKNSGIVVQWAELLSRKINQRGFHKLFKAKKKIGKGAFASVYLAERLVDNKLIAVKAFSKEKQYSGDKGKESLENEIKVMRMLEHPNIMNLLEVYETDNSIYVILEYMEGKQLNEEVKSGRKFTPEECKEILRQILSALEHLAARRIIHRDLKPQNIMFKKQNGLELALCDFGLATYADEQKYLFVRCGTPGFVAPQIINLKDLNSKSEPISDVFSAGVIFHMLLLSESVFPGKKYSDVLAQNRSCNFDFNQPQYGVIPKPALQLMVQMLQKNPNLRISASEALASAYLSCHGEEVHQSTMDIQSSAHHEGVDK